MQRGHFKSVRQYEDFLALTEGLTPNSIPSPMLGGVNRSALARSPDVFEFSGLPRLLNEF
jgi:hypothetical protein